MKYTPSCWLCGLDLDSVLILNNIITFTNRKLWLANTYSQKKKKSYITK